MPEVFFFNNMILFSEKKYYEDDTYILRAYAKDAYNMGQCTSLTLYKKQGLMEESVCSSVEYTIPDFPSWIDIDSRYTSLDSLVILNLAVDGDSIRYRFCE